MCSLTTGKVIDDCAIDDVPNADRNRYMKGPDDVRIEFNTKGALGLYEEMGMDMRSSPSPNWRQRRRYAATRAWIRDPRGA